MAATNAGPRIVLRVLAGEFHDERGHLTRSALMSMAAATMEVALVYVIASLGSYVLDGGAGSFDAMVDLDPETLAWIALGIVVLRSVMEVVRAGFDARCLQAYELKARRRIVRAYVNADWPTQTERSPGEIMGALMAFQGTASASFASVLTIGGQVASLAIMVVGSFIAGGLWVFAIMLGIGALAFAGRPILRRSHRAGHQMKEAMRDYSIVFWEAGHTALETRLHSSQTAVIQRIDKPLESVVKAGADAVYSRNLLAAIYGSVVYAIAAGGLALLAVAQPADAPAYGAVVLLLYRGLGYGRSVQSTYQSLLNATPAVQDLARERERLELSRRPMGGAAIAGHLGDVVFDRVGFAYADGANVLSDVSLRLREGEALGVVGPSGAGKSTLVQLLLRLRDPTVGSISAGDLDVREVSLDSWYTCVALVPQHPQLYTASVLENIRCFRPAIGDGEVIDALRQANVLDEMEQLPNGLDTIVGSRWGHELSGGQVQRLAIARALAGRPDLLVMDEPTSALDLPSEERVRKTLEDLKGNMTMLIVAHRLSTLRICDRVVVMGGGRIEAVGSRSDVQAESGFFAEAIRLAKLA